MAGTCSGRRDENLDRRSGLGTRTIRGASAGDDVRQKAWLRATPRRDVPYCRAQRSEGDILSAPITAAAHRRCVPQVGRAVWAGSRTRMARRRRMARGDRNLSTRPMAKAAQGDGASPAVASALASDGDLHRVITSAPNRHIAIVITRSLLEAE